LFGALVSDGRAESRVTIHGRGRGYRHVLPSLSMGCQLGQIVDGPGADRDRNCLMPLQGQIEFFHEPVFGVELRIAINERIAAENSRRLQEAQDFPAGQVEGRGIGHDQRGASSKHFPKHCGRKFEDTAADLQSPGIPGGA